MIQQIMIPLALFAMTATGASAFTGDILEKLDVELSSEQISALEEAHELRMGGADKEEVRGVLEDADIDREMIHEVRIALREYRHELREDVRAALENDDFDAFLEAIQGTGTPLEEVIDTENEFEQFVEAFNLRQTGDHEGARKIMQELGIDERPLGHGHGVGSKAQFGGNGHGNGNGGGGGRGRG